MFFSASSCISVTLTGEVALAPIVMVALLVRLLAPPPKSTLLVRSTVVSLVTASSLSVSVLSPNVLLGASWAWAASGAARIRAMAERAAGVTRGSQEQSAAAWPAR